MLFAVDRLEYVDHMIHEADFKRRKAPLSATEYRGIYDRLDQLIAGDEIHTSSWMPGANWMGTEWEPIYTNACQGNTDTSALFFGLMAGQLHCKSFPCNARAHELRRSRSGVAAVGQGQVPE